MLFHLEEEVHGMDTNLIVECSTIGLSNALNFVNFPKLEYCHESVYILMLKSSIEPLIFFKIKDLN